MSETIYRVAVYRLNNKTKVVHTFNDFDAALDYYVRKIKQGIDNGFYFDIDFDECHYDNEIQCLIIDTCVAAFTWDSDC